MKISFYSIILSLGHSWSLVRLIARLFRFRCIISSSSVQQLLSLGLHLMFQFKSSTLSHPVYSWSRHLLSISTLVILLLLTVALFRLAHAESAPHPGSHPSSQDSPLSPLLFGSGVEGAVQSDHALAAADSASDQAGPPVFAPSQPPVVEIQQPITAGTSGSQTSLVLVGAVLAGIIIVSGLAIWRRS